MSVGLDSSSSAAPEKRDILVMDMHVTIACPVVFGPLFVPYANDEEVEEEEEEGRTEHTTNHHHHHVLCPNLSSAATTRGIHYVNTRPTCFPMVQPVQAQRIASNCRHRKRSTYLLVGFGSEILNRDHVRYIHIYVDHILF